MDIFDAARTNNLKELKILLSSHNVNSTDSRGSTPLIIAAYYNNTEALLHILSKEADTDIKDHMGNTALMGACFKGYHDIVSLLLQHKASIDTENGNQATALTFAATFGHVSIINLLLDFGSDPLHKDRFNKNPIDYALAMDNAECYELLVSAITKK